MQVCHVLLVYNKSLDTHCISVDTPSLLLGLPGSSSLTLCYDLLFSTHAFSCGLRMAYASNQHNRLLHHYSTNDYVQQGGYYTHNTRVHLYVCNIHTMTTLTQEYTMVQRFSGCFDNVILYSAKTKL